MDINALKAFIAVAETGSFSLAAQRLYLTQPAVSKRIAALESQLDLTLIDRIGRRVALTQAGSTLLPRAHRILIDLEDTRRSLSNLSGKVSGTLNLGISHHLGLHRLPPLLKSFADRYPDATLDIQFLDSEVAYEGVIQGTIELAITTLDKEPVDRVHAQTIWDDPLDFVVSREHVLATLDDISLADLSRQGAILPDLHTITGAIPKRLFDEHHLPLKLDICTNYMETIKMMVSIGLGWSVLPRTLIDGQLTILKIKGVQLVRELGAIYHADRTLSNSAKAFLELLGSKPGESNEQGNGAGGG